MKHILETCGEYLNDYTDGEYTLKQTCGACPEQYDMLDKQGNTVGYFRLRHGSFTVTYPDVGGKLVFRANPEGDGGMFEDYEREYYLTLGFLAIMHEIERNNYEY